MNFQISQLVAYGLHADLVQCIASDGVSELLPLQVQAITASDLLRGGNLLVLAPTSAGKTLLGEIAACRHWQAGRKAVFLAPTRALVSAQYRHLRRRFEGAGIRVVMSTADHTQHDEAIRQGQFDFAVMVYEKCRSFLVTSPGFVYTVGVVVADELQVLHDPDRGGTADMLLSRLAHGEIPIQIIGLSAVLEDASKVARWLDAQVLSSTSRPCELREGVWCGQHGAFHFKAGEEWKDEHIGEVQTGAVRHTDLPGKDGLAQAAELAMSLARRGESCLVFVPTRAICRQMALALAQEMGRQPDWTPDGCMELALAEESAMRRLLEVCLPAGVGVHNSDLTAELREAVERRFNGGHIRILVATPTLAQGVNLRAKNVIQIPVMMSPHASAGSLSTLRRPQVSLSLERYRNQAGRAGRYGGGENFGRSILVAQSHTEALRLARQFIESAEMSGGNLSLSCHAALEGYVLDFVESGVAGTFSEIVAAMRNTFAGQQGAGRLAADVVEEELFGHVTRLIEWNFLEETAAGRLCVTGLGQVAAAGGFRSSSVREMMRHCGDWTGGPPGMAEALLVCAMTEDGEEFPLSATADEVRSRRWLRAAEAMLRRENTWEKEAVQGMLRPAGGLSPQRHGMIKMAVLATAWLSRRTTAELEQEFGVPAGVISGVATHLAWIMGGLVGCAQVADCRDDVCAHLRQIAGRLPLGLASSASGLSSVRVPGLTRNYLHQLAAEGFDSIKAIQSAGTEMLAQIIPQELAERLFTEYCCLRTADMAGMPRQPDAPPPSPGSRPKVSPTEVTAAGPDYELIVDELNPGTVVYRGQAVQLSPKPYALLGVLARRCGATVSYLEIDRTVWPDEKVEPQQISAHKRRLVQELARASNRQEAERLIVTAPRFGIRLNLEPRRVQIRHAPGTG